MNKTSSKSINSINTNTNIRHPFCNKIPHLNPNYRRVLRSQPFTAADLDKTIKVVSNKSINMLLPKLQTKNEKPSIQTKQQYESSENCQQDFQENILNKKQFYQTFHKYSIPGTSRQSPLKKQQKIYTIKGVRKDKINQKSKDSNGNKKNVSKQKLKINSKQKHIKSPYATSSNKFNKVTFLQNQKTNIPNKPKNNFQQSKLNYALQIKDIILKPINNKNKKTSPKKGTNLLKRVQSGLKWVIQNKLSKAKSFLNQNKIQDCIQVLNQILEKQSNNVQALYCFAQVCQKQNDLQVALKYYQSITECYHQKLGKNQLILMIISYQKLQKYTQALQICQKLQNAYVDPIIYKLKGVCEYQLQNFDDSLILFQQFLKKGQPSQQLQALQKIGNIYFKFRLFHKALHYYNQCLSLFVESQYQQSIIQKKTECLKRINQNKNNHKKNQLQQFLSQKQYIKAYQKVILDKKKSLNRQDKITLVQGLKEKGFYTQAIQVLSLTLESKVNSQDLKQRAKLFFKIGQFQKCYEDFQRFVKLSQISYSPLAAFLQVNKQDKNSQSQKIFCALNTYMNKIKQLQACSLSQSQSQGINARRNHNLAQAIKLFDSVSNSQNMQQSGLLSVIAEESTISILKDSKFYQNATADIFALKQIRKALQIWKNYQFSLDSLNQITHIAFDLVKSDKTDFSIVPLHIVVHTLRQMKQKTFIQANREVQQKIVKLSELYPPTQIDITKSKLEIFNLNFKNKQKVNLFGDTFYFNNYKEIYKKIKELSQEANSQRWLMDEKVKEICQNFGGFQYKSGVKLPTSDQQEKSSEKVYCRIIQKILLKSLSSKKQQFLNNFNPKQKGFGQYFEQLMKKWQKFIDQILQQNKQNKIQTPCYVYDLMRAKCMFKTVYEIQSACKKFIQSQNQKSFTIIEIDNRLSKKTKDVVLKIKFKNIVGEIQLALQFQSLKNEFNHGLYELCRSPFGPFFASFMWLTGFANQQKIIILRQKLKWDLKKLNHLHKFIYEDKIQLNFGDEQQIINKQFKKLYLVDFLVDSNSIQGYLMNENQQYLCNSQNQSANGKQFRLFLSKQKPKTWFKLKLLKDSFAHDIQNYLLTIRLISRRQFLCISQGRLQFQELNSSIMSNVFKIQFLQSKKDYSQQIEQAKKLQKDVLQMIKQ